MRSGGDRTFGSGAVAILLGAAMWGMLGPTYAKIQDWVASTR